MGGSKLAAVCNRLQSHGWTEESLINVTPDVNFSKALKIENYIDCEKNYTTTDSLFTNRSLVPREGSQIFKCAAVFADSNQRGDGENVTQ